MTQTFYSLVFSQEIREYVSRHIYLHLNVHSNFTCDGPTLETIQTSINQQMDRNVYTPGAEDYSSTKRCEPLTHTPHGFISK